ncbi:MAG: glycosyltransferase family 2 protein, partial [Ruminococcaceae bacterium]|nr:glycosyltransferase family 2 protein [Oscillospiraceae bacterium]
MKTKLSFVIPCYGSEKTIANVVEEIKSTVSLREDEYDYEIILVNDHSPDDVYSIITKLAQEDKNIKGLDLAKNFGQHSALLAGFHYVTGDIIVCLDDDGQTPADQMFKLIDALDEKTDVVFAEYAEKKHSLFRNLGSFANDLMARILLGKPKNLKIMSYFACKKYVAKEILRYDNSYPYMSGLLLRTTKNITNVLVQHREREEGASGYTLKKLLTLWFNGFTSFSVIPLRISTYLGLFFASLGFIYTIYIVVNKFININTPIGYSSIMAAIMFIGGIIMLMLGFLGEYIGRIY